MCSHILMLSHQGVGHTNPQLALCTQLIQDGHQVSYLCDAKFKDAINRAGATWIPTSNSLPNVNYNLPPAERATLFSHMLVAEAQLNLAGFHKFHSQNPQHYDAIAFGTFSLAGPILGKMLDIPQIQLWASAVTPLDSSNRTRILADGERTFTHITDDFLQTYRIDYQPSSTLSEHNIGFYPQFFQLGGDNYPDNFHFIGPCLHRRIDDDSWNPPTNLLTDSPMNPLTDSPTDPSGIKNPIIYISLGTYLNNNIAFYQHCIEALSDAFCDRRYHVVLSVGTLIDIEDLGVLPANFTVGASFPQLKVLSHADLFVSHAGMNSAMEGLYYNVPFVLFPQQAEQEYNAQRLVDLGVGRLLSPQCNSYEIREKIAEVLTNPCYQHTAEVLGQQTREAGGVHRGARIIEGIAAA